MVIRRKSPIGTVTATSLYDDSDGKRQARRNKLRLRHKLIEKKALEIELMAVSKKCAEPELALDLQKLHSHYSDSLPDKDAHVPKEVYDAVPHNYLGDYLSCHRDDTLRDFDDVNDDEEVLEW